VLPESRGYVAGRRNAILALVYIVTSVASGFILNHTPFTLGYQVIFTIGLFSAGLSTYHRWHLRRIAPETVEASEEICPP
jgi:hypothetical protein